MASIKDLKNNQETIIDATGGSPVTNDVVSIDTTKPAKGNGKTVVDLNGMFTQPKGRHTTIEPKSNTQKRVQQKAQTDDIDIDITGESNGRVAADLSSLPDMTPEEAAYAKEHFVEDPMERMLEGEDSILGKYLTNKEEELKVGYEAVAYNKKKEELEKEAEETGDDSALIDFLNDNSDVESIPDNNLSVDDDDILSSLDDTDEEEVKEEEIEVAENKKQKAAEEEVVKDEILEAVEEELLDDEEESIEDIEEEDIEEETEPVDVMDNEDVEEEIEEDSENEETEESYDMDVVYDNDLEVNDVEEEIEDDSDDEEDITVTDEEVPEPEPEETEVLNRLKELATEKLKPVSKKLDISSFTVIKKPVTNTKQFNVKPVKQAKWVLMNQEATVFMKEFTGAELERLREFTQESSGTNPSLQSLIKRYRMIYDHILGAKPASFEQWMKSTPLSDEDNYFFAIYIASFKGANYIPRDCTDQDKCKEMWLTDDIPIMDMVKFENDEAKSKFTKIYKEEYTGTTKAGLYVSEIIPISDSLAIAFKEPSLYTRTEFMTLERDFREKYAAILDFIPYIDSIYYIDQTEGTLTPVGYKSYADNTLKTTKSKIQQFAKVLNTLSIDEFSVIRPYMNAVAERTSGVSYIVPETTCPKCGTVVPEGPTSAEELLFTRYQLGALVNTSLN